MTATPPSTIRLPPPPSQSELFNSALATDTPSDTPNSSSFLPGQVPLPKARRKSAGRSFSTVGHGYSSHRRVSKATFRGVDDLVGDADALKLPTLVPGIRPAYSTPLPVLPMVVLCIAMLSELLAANLCTPFLLKMVEGFFLDAGKPKNSETEAAVGLWTGNLVSVFFITQFFTSLLWSSIADKHGRRAVIVASLAGSAVALVVFGTSESLPEAICVRLVQGIFGGAVGVFRGSIRDLTDDTNATRAYAVLGFSWGFGGVIGPILGGVFESPADNFPGSFLGRIGFFQTFPYLLPTVIAGALLVTGSILACFLSWDGGVRGGTRIALPVEKNEPLIPQDPLRQPSPVPSHRTAVPSVRAKRSVLSPLPDPESAAYGAGYPGLNVGSVPHGRRDSRASLGTAYGYGGIRSKHPTLAARAALEAARRVSGAPRRSSDAGQDEPETSEESGPLGFAQKLLLANEENTFNLNDLWLSAAVAQDMAVFEDDDATVEENEQDEDDDMEEPFETTPQPSPAHTPGSQHPDSIARRRFTRGRMASIQGSLGYRSGAAHRLSVSQGGRRFSTSSGQMPSIFANTGLASPPPITAIHTDPDLASPSGGDPFFQSPVPERRQAGLSVITERNVSTTEASPLLSPAAEVTDKAKGSAWGALPLMVILQYGLLALHNTTHDQLFLSFLVSPYRSGGIGLNPAHFSLLIALMCLCQLYYQFYLYPRLGPPLGRFSHLQMFRLGCFLYIPAYAALPLLHAFASEQSGGSFIVMTREAVRYCGGTLAYTSIMVLINVMSPPHVVGLANGLAQSVVSFSRFFGPVIGGAVWSASINGNPAGYPIGFYIVAAGCLLQWSLSFLIR
ncbi:hypothetical protein M231_07078 [Tremella mesenterica]|uniref:Major facilitator superfamily (MFS) profile domain-containing protein n=1 Tax=Tremella mesenterica TaxID=5217 RepID=A0A4Q1BA47_TREME|nr:hypothetical protein M231_07078 [Tremella mesenterica]